MALDISQQLINLRSLSGDASPAAKAGARGSNGRQNGHTTNGHDKAVIYLAETTADLTLERDRIRRELSQFGYRVVPDKELPGGVPPKDSGSERSRAMNQANVDFFAEIGARSNPFPGLRPFEVDESHLFFGRSGQSQQLIAKLGATRFLAVVGTSGSGKSSLARAGLLPAFFGGFMTGAGMLSIRWPSRLTGGRWPAAVGTTRSSCGAGRRMKRLPGRGINEGIGQG